MIMYTGFTCKVDPLAEQGTSFAASKTLVHAVAKDAISGAEVRNAMEQQGFVDFHLQFGFSQASYDLGVLQASVFSVSLCVS